jgi:hypothetical protein
MAQARHQIRRGQGVESVAQGELQFLSKKMDDKPTLAYLQLASGEICAAAYEGQNEIQFSGSPNCEIKVVTQARR